MVKKKIKYSLVIYDHEFNDENFLTEAISSILGYEITQAANCASIITNKGKYPVISFEQRELEKAQIILEMFTSQSIPARLDHV